MSQDKLHRCRCKAMDKLVLDEDCPIVFEESLNEYNIVSRTGSAYYRVYYCFFCGGALPKSRRDKLFTKPTSKELAEVKKLLADVHSVSEVIQVLGKPDRESDPPAEADDQPENNRKHYLYSQRWKSLDLTVRERSDGSFELAAVGKFISSQESVTPRRNGRRGH